MTESNRSEVFVQAVLDKKSTIVSHKHAKMINTAPFTVPLVKCSLRKNAANAVANNGSKV